MLETSSILLFIVFSKSSYLGTSTPKSSQTGLNSNKYSILNLMYLHMLNFLCICTCICTCWILTNNHFSLKLKCIVKIQDAENFRCMSRNIISTYNHHNILWFQMHAKKHYLHLQPSQYIMNYVFIRF